MWEISAAELVGYAASLLVVVSLAMTSVLKLRILSLAGSLTFVGYGFLIGSVPIVLTNVAIVVLNVVFLARASRIETFFRALEVQPDSAFVSEFLRFYRDDIVRFDRGFAGVRPGDSVFWILRDAVPAGILIGQPREGVFDVELDYAIKQYRDLKAGRWLFGPGAGHFTEMGVGRIEAKTGTRKHNRYLRRMGFRRDGGRFVLYLD